MIDWTCDTRNDINAMNFDLTSQSIVDELKISYPY